MGITQDIKTNMVNTDTTWSDITSHFREKKFTTNLSRHPTISFLFLLRPPLVQLLLIIKTKTNKACINIQNKQEVCTNTNFSIVSLLAQEFVHKD